MKAVILAGGFGTRLSEETVLKPKPMVEVGGRPILWHIMKIYSHYGINDFIILCGYRSYVIKEYFSNYFLHCSDVTFDMASNQATIHKRYAEPWKVTLLETGLDTMTGGRLKRATDYIGGEAFCFTYGDGLSDVDVSKVIEFHKKSGARATVTAMKHSSRFGVLHIDGPKVTRFAEKPIEESNWMNSGFFVLEPEVLDLISGDDIVFEKEPIEALVKKNQLAAYQHDGFFQGMDSLRDKTALDAMWEQKKAPWRKW